MVKKYEQPVQLSLDDEESDELKTNKGTLDISNKYGRERTQFKPGNKQGIRFAPKQEPDNQLEIES